jgi:transcriptional regulator with XRE-family HTH domain
LNKNVEISVKLKEFIKEKFNNNAASLARELNIFPQTLQKYLNGERKPGRIFLIKLSKVGLDLKYLLDLDQTNNGTTMVKVEEPIDNYGSCIEKEITELKNEIKKVQEEIEEVRARNRELINEREKCWEFIKQLGLENQFLKIFDSKVNLGKQNSLDTS